jgi:O-antigen ligase
MLSAATIKTFAIFVFVAGIYNPLALSFYGLNLYSSDAGLVILIVTTLLSLMPRRIGAASKFSMTLICLFMIFGLISSCMSLNIGKSLGYYNDYLKLLFFFALVGFNRDMELALFRAVKFFFYYALLIGLVQILTGTSFGNIGQFFGSSEIQEITFLGGMKRISGTAPHPNIYGQILVVGYIFSMFSILKSQRYYQLLIVFILTLIVILHTLSRANLAYYILANLIILFYLYRMSVGFQKVLSILIFIFIFMSVAVMSNLGVFEVLLSRVEGTVDAERSEFMAIAFKLLEYDKVKFFGTGLGDFFGQASHYGLGYATEAAHWRDLSGTDVSVHNVVALWIVELGFVAAFPLCILYFVCLKTSFRDILSLTPREYSVVIISSLFPFMLYMSAARFPLIYLYGLILLLQFKRKAKG